jgi:hypothetical protein
MRREVSELKVQFSVLQANNLRLVNDNVRLGFFANLRKWSSRAQILEACEKGSFPTLCNVDNYSMGTNTSMQYAVSSPTPSVAPKAVDFSKLRRSHLANDSRLDVKSWKFDIHHASQLISQHLFAGDTVKMEETLTSEIDILVRCRAALTELNDFNSRIDEVTEFQPFYVLWLDGLIASVGCLDLKSFNANKIRLMLNVKVNVKGKGPRDREGKGYTDVGVTRVVKGEIEGEEDEYDEMNICLPHPWSAGDMEINHELKIPHGPLRLSGNKVKDQTIFQAAGVGMVRDRGDCSVVVKSCLTDLFSIRIFSLVYSDDGSSTHYVSPGKVDARDYIIYQLLLLLPNDVVASELLTDGTGEVAAEGYENSVTSDSYEEDESESDGEDDEDDRDDEETQNMSAKLAATAVGYTAAMDKENVFCGALKPSRRFKCDKVDLNYEDKRESYESKLDLLFAWEARRNGHTPLTATTLNVLNCRCNDNS